jgi:hypothetical protein
MRQQFSRYSGTCAIPTPEFSDTKNFDPKVFLLTKIKPEYSDILYNLTHFPGPLVCQIRQVPLYKVFFIYKLGLENDVQL